jgi:hypothetical protein
MRYTTGHIWDCILLTIHSSLLLTRANLLALIAIKCAEMA